MHCIFVPIKWLSKLPVQLLKVNGVYPKKLTELGGLSYLSVPKLTNLDCNERRANCLGLTVFAKHIML